MSKKTKLPADPHSEAALQWCVKNWHEIEVVQGEIDQIVLFAGKHHDEIAAILHLRDIIKKRQPLTGIKKQVAGIVRGKRKKERK